VAHREVGLLMGVTTAIGSLTNILAPLAAGAVYDKVMVGAPYWMGATLFLLAAFVLWKQPLAKHIAAQPGPMPVKEARPL
jgi:predicted MFS family arabinose efflux permease